MKALVKRDENPFMNFIIILQKFGFNSKDDQKILTIDRKKNFVSYLLLDLKLNSDSINCCAFKSNDLFFYKINHFLHHSWLQIIFQKFSNFKLFLTKNSLNSKIL